MSEPIHIHVIVSQPFEENTYIVWQPGRTDALVIDPGLEPDAILDFLADNGLTPAAILNTHGHADHIGDAIPLAAYAIDCGHARQRLQLLVEFTNRPA